MRRRGDNFFYFDPTDEVYTTIQEPNQQLYMSGSETYAQIQPLPLTVEVEVNPVPSSSRTSSLERQESLQQSYEPAPQPPSVDSLKHVAHSHSRQGELVRMWYKGCPILQFHL